MSNNAKEVGKRLKEARAEILGLPIEACASKMQLSVEEVEAIEAGQREATEEELDKFSRLYRLRKEYFLQDDTPWDDPSREQKVMELFNADQPPSAHDTNELLKFARFLQHAGPAPAPYCEPTTTQSPKPQTP